MEILLDSLLALFASIGIWTIFQMILEHVRKSDHFTDDENVPCAFISIANLSSSSKSTPQSLIVNWNDDACKEVISQICSAECICVYFSSEKVFNDWMKECKIQENAAK